MKNIANEIELVSQINSNNYYFNGNNFENYSSLKNAAENFFKSILEDYDGDVEEYYQRFGGLHIEKVRVEKFFNEEGNTTLTVDFYEGYIDSGVPAEDYFYGYIISEN